MPMPWEKYQQQQPKDKAPWENYATEQNIPEGDIVIQPGQEVPEGYEAYHDPMLGTVAKPIQEDQTLQDRLVGAGEAALATGTAATTGAVGDIVGKLQGLYESLSTGKYGTREGADIVKNLAEEYAQKLTYEPRTEAGQEYTQAISEAAAPLVALTPAAAEIGAVASAAKPIVSKASKAISKPIAEEVDLIRSAMPDSQKVQRIKTLARENPTSKEVAEYKIVKSPSGERVIKDPQATEAIKQGFEDRVIASVKSASDLDRKKMLQMLNIHKSGKKSAKFAAMNRPSDILGKSLDERIKFVSNAKKEAVNDLENAAKNLKGKSVNFDPAVNDFMKSLEEIGVKVDTKNGKLSVSLSGSDIEGDIASKKLLNRVFDRLVNTKVPDAYDVHRAKRYIDTQVSYGKTKANPLSRTTENIVKNLRRGLNDSLREYSDEYKAANEKYSDSINALESIQDAAGTKIDLEGKNVDKALGTASRKLLSNYGSRVNMIDALDSVESVAKKYGMKIDDDIVNQVIFANEIDRMFGAPAPASFKGQIEQAVSKGTDMARRGITESAIDMAVKGIEKARGINEENAIKAMEEILKRKEK